MKFTVLKTFLNKLTTLKITKVFFGYLIKYVYKIKLFPAVLISLLILSIFAGIASSALTVFYEHKKAVFKRMELSLDSYHFFLKDSLNDLKIRFTSSSPSLKSQLKSFYLTIDRESIDELNSDLPRSGKEKYYKAYMKVGAQGDVLPIKLRYRGDNLFHWMYPQKSLRIKLGGEHLYDMQRKINLVNPPRMEGYVLDSVSYELAKELGVISPDFYPVRTYINGSYMGVYTFLSQSDESLLRKHKRMPGSIYVGDGAKVTKQKLSELWFDQSNWKKVAARNAEQKNDREDIKYFIDAATNFSNLEFNEFFNSMINKDKYYAYMALDVILGSSHHDYHHNHKIYFDPYLGKFEPIEWDVRYWTAQPDKDESLYPLLEQMKLNPIFEYERDKVTYKLLTDEKFYNGIHQKVSKYNTLVLPELKADPYRDNAEGFTGFGHFSKKFTIDRYEKSIERLHTTLDSRKKLLMKIYQNSDSSYYSKKIKNGQILVFKVQGNSPVTFDFSTLFEKSNTKVYRDLNFNGRVDYGEKIVSMSSKETLYPGRKKIDAHRQGGLKIVKGPYLIKNAPQYFSYIVLNTTKQVNKTIIAVNAITGKSTSIANKNFKIDVSLSDSIHPWTLPKGDVIHHILRGNIDVKSDFVFKENEKVKIESGTIFTMYPGTSVFFYGEVTANGSENKPIRFIAKDRLKPWGSVVLQGKKSSGSLFNYVEFSGGSVTSRNLINYTAQFNIHDTSDFKVTNCKVGHNHIGDDSMHIAYSSGTVDKTLFYNARSDALDIDISQVSITNSIFINSGNDSLDLMTTEANVKNNLFINAGDKGISTGEWSFGNFSNNLFYQCFIGVEVKDKSIVHAENSIFINNKDKAINLYNKNSRYDEGGEFFADKVVIIGNPLINADKRSSINIKKILKGSPNPLEYTFVKELLEAKSNNMNFNKLVLETYKRYEH